MTCKVKVKNATIGVGMGLFAATPLRRREVAILEPALLHRLIANNVLLVLTEEVHATSSTLLAFRNLDLPMNRRFSLDTCDEAVASRIAQRTNSPPDEVHATYLTLATSNIAIAIDEQQTGAAVYAATSRSNHSCAPNVEPKTFYSYEDDMMWCELVALSKIARGDELTWNYAANIPHFLAWHAEERREHLRREYHFDCMCPRCIAENSKR